MLIGKLYITTEEILAVFEKFTEYWVKFLKIKIDGPMTLAEVILIKDSSSDSLVSDEEIKATAFREVCEVLYSQEKYKSDFLKDIISSMDGFQMIVLIGDVSWPGYWKRAFDLRRSLVKNDLRRR